MWRNRNILWDCIEAKKIWQAFNELMTNMKQQEDKVLNYDAIFRIGDLGTLSKIKIKISQGMIQVEQQVNWSFENVSKITNEIKQTELYNAKIKNK
jgi:histone deacetylase complex regulatory component SIN3